MYNIKGKLALYFTNDEVKNCPPNLKPSEQVLNYLSDR